ncbi:MAG: TonB-dependent receptor, partial [Nitrospirales bacterium]|nr:TonB-dependent receptor [Nitrospirales bacterium]
HLIDLDPSLLNQGIFQLTNLQGTTTHGVEGALTFSPNKALSLQGSLTYLKTHITGTNEPLRNRPKWQGGLTLTALPHPTLTLYGRMTWVGSSRDFQVPTQTTDVGGYTKIDLTLTYHMLKVLNWYVAFENLTNTSYQAFEGFPAPPLTFRFGLEYRLS